MRRLTIVAVSLAVFSLITSPAQTSATKPAGVPPADPTATPPQIKPASPPAAASDISAAPAILVSAGENNVTTVLSFDGSTSPDLADIKSVTLTSSDSPSLQRLLTFKAEEPKKSGTFWLVTVHLTGSIPFGTSTVSIYSLTRRVATLTLRKLGLSVQGPTDSQRQSAPLLLTIQNPSDFNYTSVSARLRFEEDEVCIFSDGKLDHGPPSIWARLVHLSRGLFKSPETQTCGGVRSWKPFAVPSRSSVSLRAVDLPDAWFHTPDGYSRPATLKGTLTLIPAADAVPPPLLEEQSLPIEVNFQPDSFDLVVDYGKIVLLIFVGALCSLFLRVVIPSYRRYRAIKEQLVQIEKTIRAVSDEVDSMLRVQLDVECKSLDIPHPFLSVITPSFGETAQRIETSIATLSRRIGYVRRLDAALSRRRLLIVNELAQPTRIAAIDRNLHAALEELKSDQFREQDWVYIQTLLEAADKGLGDPTEEDKSAFETVLTQRWTSIAVQYGFTAAGGWTQIPDALMLMESCFPRVETLCPRKPKVGGMAQPITEGNSSSTDATPAPADSAAQPKTENNTSTTAPTQKAVDDSDQQIPVSDDINQWIKVAGTVRADLQITALELIREFQFLAPGTVNGRWATDMKRLIPWLATPVFQNLNSARLLLRELAESVATPELLGALRNKEARIELEPQSVLFGERAHLSFRFWDPRFDAAAARQEIVCEWRFKPTSTRVEGGSPKVKPKSNLNSGKWWMLPIRRWFSKGSAAASNAATVTQTGADHGSGSQTRGAEDTASAGTETITPPPEAFETLYYVEKGWEVYRHFDRDAMQAPVSVRFHLDGHEITKDDQLKEPLVYESVIPLKTSSKTKGLIDKGRGYFFGAIELSAALLVPIVAIAVSSVGKGPISPWWQLVGLGFGSDTIRNVLSGASDNKTPKPQS